MHIKCQITDSRCAMAMRFAAQRLVKQIGGSGVEPPLSVTVSGAMPPIN